MTETAIAAVCAPEGKGRKPLCSVSRVMPRLQTSLLAVYLSALMRSGDMKESVPVKVSALCPSLRSRMIPKSDSFTHPRESHRMLAGCTAVPFNGTAERKRHRRSSTP